MKINKKKLKWILTGVGVTAAAITVPIYVNGISLNSVSKRSSPHNNAVSTTTNVANSSRLDSSKFFKISNQGLVSTSIPSMGRISAFKISGLPYTTDSNSIKSTAAKQVYYETSQGNTTLKLKPEYIDAGRGTASVVGDQASVNNFAAPQAVELNYLLSTPTSLNNIGLALDLNVYVNWSKIGSISIMTEDGTVYRADSIKLSDLFPSGTVSKDGTTPNISFANIKSWNKWSKVSIVSDKDFMWSYDRNDLGFSFDASNQIYFYDGSIENKSITPIISGGTVNAILDSSSLSGGTYDDSKPQITKDSVVLSEELTNGQKMSFLDEVNDINFRNTFMDALNIRSASFDALTTNILSDFDLHNSKEYIDDLGQHNFFYPENSKEWDLTLAFDGSSSTIDRASLANLKALDVFKNVRKVKIYNNNFLNSSDDWNTFYLNDLSWISNYKKLDAIIASAKNSKNWNDKIQSSLHTIGDFAQMSWLGELSNLKVLDISSMQTIGNGDIVDQIQSASMFTKNFMMNFEIYISPGNFEKAKNSNMITNTYDVSNFLSKDLTQPSFAILKKKIAPSFISPKIMINPNYVVGGPNPKYVFNEITVDGKKINAIIKHGQLYWDFMGQNIDPAEIEYLDKGGTYYTSAYASSNNIDMTTLSGISKTLDYYDQLPVSSIILSNDGDINSSNFNTINNFINVDNKNIGKVVYNSKMMYNIDIDSIHYYVQDNNDIYYFTSLDKIIEKYGLEKIGSLNLFTIQPNNNGADFKSYSQIKKDEFILQDPKMYENNSLNVDGKAYGEVIHQGALVWDTKGIKIQDIIFKNMAGKLYYTTPFDATGQLIPNLVSIKPHDPYLVIPKPFPAVEEPGPITRLDDMGKTITIDGKKSGVRLNDGIVQYDTDITTIKYVRVYKDQNDLNLYEYYTSLTVVPKTIPVSEISSIEQSKDQLSAEKVITNSYDINSVSNFSNIRIDNKTYPIVVRNGKAYWGVDQATASKVRYCDRDNNYYTSLTSENFQNVGMSQVAISYSAAPENTLFTFPQKLASSNSSMVDQGMDFISTQGKNQVTSHNNFVVKDGVVYINSAASHFANFATKDVNGKIKYYFSIKDMPGSDLVNAWSIENKMVDSNGSESPVPEEAIIPSPEKRKNISSPYDKLVIFNGTVPINVDVVYDSSQEKYLYTNIDELKKIKYVDTNGNYYESLNYVNSYDNLSSVDLSKSDLNQNAIPLSIDSSQIKKSSKEIGKYIGIFGATTSVVALSTWGWISYAKKKRGTK